MFGTKKKTTKKKQKKKTTRKYELSFNKRQF